MRCSLPGKWRLRKGAQTRPIAVGDRVRFSLLPSGEGVVEGVEPRKGGKLSRKAAGEREAEQVVAANVDQLVVVASVAEPELNRRLLDRLVVSGEHGGLDVAVCLNKIDLADAAAYEPVLELYRRLGYRALATSAVSGVGLEDLRAALRDKTSVFAGQSGVGKSALLMSVQPGLDLRVGDVSASTGKGRHTTTAVSLLPLEFGGYVVDTPGIREFALYNIERDELQHCFPEMAERFGQCRFADCSHRHEPGCAIAAAVESGAIDPERYESYCRIYESLPAPDPARRRR
ncbi:MAG TPA: ribosome small subunit-dependent GTPase A [Planctomycetota bacterium]|nr:ribosome small subunit-dependent GTPase A [Planctomycetota bacterium]HRR80957.1 ribosome small subunit-dependent GTPase A [Planctomycetota bacterium]HRT94659.1 ribosome small subunit-dependent GTPase A [Planctomycetota bacterium]